MDSAEERQPPANPAPINRLLKDSSIYFLGNMLSRVVGFIAIPFYSRFLSAAEYGLLELVELSTQTVAIAFGLQAVGAALSRLFYDQKTPEAERAVVSTSLIGTAMLSAIVTVVAVASAGRLSGLMFHTQQWTTLLQAAFVGMFLGNMVEVVLVYERMRNNARFFFFYTLTMLGGTLALNIVLIGFMGAGVWGFIISKLVMGSVGGLFLLLRMRRDVGWRWRSLYVPELVRFGAPLIVSSLAYFAIHFSDRFFLSSAVTLADLGRYSLAYRFAFLVAALVGDSFTKSWGVTMYRYTDESDWREKFARVGAYFTLAVCVTGLGIALFSPELLQVMVPPDYYPPRMLLPIILLAYLARELGDFFRSLMLINKRSGLVGVIAVGGAVLNLAGNALLIPSYGLFGAAYSTLLTWVAYLIVCWVVANREHRLPMKPSAYVRLTVLMIAVFSVGSGARVHSLPLQVILDGVWLLVFCAASFAFFLNSAERRGTMELAGSVLLWLLVRGLGGGETPPDGKLRVLMLAYYYPPQNEIGAARPHRFARYLRRAGTQVDVVTSTRMPYGRGEEPDVYRVPGSGAPWRAGEEASRERWSVRAGGAVAHVLETLFLPYDDRLGWFPQAYRTASSLVGPGTVLFSTHPPAVTHFVALALAHRRGLPWIADFRDPLWGNPYRTSQRAAIIDPLLEHLTVKHADAILANTEASAGLLRSRYPALVSKIHVMWNGFDPEDGLTSAPPPQRARRIIAHVGTLYGNRTPLPFLMSLDRLIRQGRLDPDTIQFRQIGRADPSCLDTTDPVLAGLLDRGCCMLVNYNVPIAEARAAMLEAEWLLLLDMNVVNPGLQVPAKTYEYVRTGRPILALTVPGSSTDQILARSGVAYATADLNTEPNVFDAAVYDFLCRPIAISVPSASFLADFGAPRQVEHLLEIMEAVRAKRGA